MYKQIETGTIEKGKIQQVFACIYAPEAKPYINYDPMPELKDVNVPLVLMSMRWDGTIGFPGGHTDGQDLQTALIREMFEEINADAVDARRFEPLATFASDRHNIHSFSYRVTENEIRRLQILSMGAPHFISENQGCFLTQIFDDKGKGYSQLLKNNFCATARMELELLVSSKGLLNK